MVEEVSKVVPELDNWMHTVQIPDTTLFESFGSGQSAAHSAYNNIRSEEGTLREIPSFADADGLRQFLRRIFKAASDQDPLTSAAF
ncbi:hypothetical protein AAVH_18521 [Aphelenchoides avenae]|nr:hypothetical protein AAVH_18521 [Aphelenchus avenae]